MKRFYLLTALFALTAAGCVKVGLVNIPPPSPENLTVEQTDYTLGAFEERTATAVFTATADWTLSVVYDEPETGAGDETGAAGADAAWLTADVAGGAAGEQSVGISAARNFQASPRTAYVDLLCGEQTVRLTVTQTGLSDDMDFSALFDETFAQKLQERDIVADAEKITMQEMQSMAAMAELDISGTYSNPGSLTSLRGIAYFESLTSLNCIYNQLPTLDVSGCTALTTLNCCWNELTELDVSQNTALTELRCDGNQLTELDVRANTALAELHCDNNQLTELDVRAYTALTELWCQNNSLTELDVSQNTELMYLICNNNHLALLDVSQNTALTELRCGLNQLTEVDVSQNTKLTKLSCGSNQLPALNVSQNTALTELECEDNPGDGESTFPLTVWNDFNPDNIFNYFSKKTWEYGGKTITIQYEYKTAE